MSVTAEGISDASVTLRWSMSDSTGIASYRIYIRGSGDTDFHVGSTSAIQRGSVSGLQTGALYAFKVAAVNAIGLEGPQSEIVEARPAVLFILLAGNAEVTASPTVTVTAVCPGFDQIRMAESLAGLGSVGYQPLGPGGTAVFTFTGADGVKSAFAQFENSTSGNESVEVSDGIRLDRVAAITSVSHNAGATPRSAGFVVHFQMVTGETDGTATVDIGSARTGIRLLDDGSGGDPVAGDGVYEANYTVEPTFDANGAFVTGHFTDRAGNVAIPVQAPVLMTISNPPAAVTLESAVPQGGGRVLLQWSTSGATDFQAYRIWHAPTTPVLGSSLRVLDSTITVRTTTTFTTDSLAVGGALRFLVEVVDAAGNATPSNELSAAPTAVAEQHAALLSRRR
jgi:hypothetical protein